MPLSEMEGLGLEGQESDRVDWWGDRCTVHVRDHGAWDPTREDNDGGLETLLK